jgi:hypothetical protein
MLAGQLERASLGAGSATWSLPSLFLRATLILANDRCSLRNCGGDAERGLGAIDEGLTTAREGQAALCRAFLHRLTAAKSN